ncbi:MAG: DUF1365 domain-containing protein [Acidobacteriota bacterium]|nr:DUF1365 domain-containing protein [Acidobacteriota bacterium]
MRSALYKGSVRHRRFEPVRHEFRYRLYMTYLDLDELAEVFAGRWLWSTRRPALVRFRRRDHYGDPSQPLAEAIRDLVDERTGRRPAGPVALLTNLRHAGYVFNPISVYYCFDPSGERVENVVAEVSNTPWNERHMYVLGAPDHATPGAWVRERGRKELHVSPFMGMSQTYDWSVSHPGRRLGLHMESRESGGRVFDATLLMQRVEIGGGSLARVLVLHPLMTARVFAGIHWQAFRLWRKGCPVHFHPGAKEPAEGQGRCPHGSAGEARGGRSPGHEPRKVS